MFEGVKRIEGAQDMYEVQSRSRNFISHMVDLRQETCTCEHHTMKQAECYHIKRAKIYRALFEPNLNLSEVLKK